MTTSASETLVPSRVYVYLADVGTAAPADAVVAMAAPFKNVGHTTPDSLSFTTAPEFAEINSHQSDYSIRRVQTSDSASVSVDLMQWNAANLISAYGGGVVTEVTPGSGKFKFVPPAVGERKEKTAVIELIDGSKHYRYVFPRVLQIEGVQNEFQKGQEARLPLRLAVLGDDSTAPWYLLSDDPALTVTP